MKENNSQNIIHSYFGKHLSKRARYLFGRWLRRKEDAPLKENLLLELWQQSPAEVTDETHNDWEKLQNHIYLLPDTNKIIPFYRNLLKYAAVIGLMFMISSTTYYLTNRAATKKHIEMAEFFVPFGESKMITLPDSSNVWVDAGSMLVYPLDFTHMDTRSVYLTGKASFTVKKNPEKPFIVKTTYMNVEALGTVFTVKSYPSEIYTEATLEKGSVRVDIKGQPLLSSILKPNQQLVYSHKDNNIHIHTVDATLYGMEREGYLIFENASFSQLITAIERKFNVVIQCNSQKYMKESYNVKFAPDETLEDLLNVLQQLNGLHYKIKKNVVFIN